MHELHLNYARQLFDQYNLYAAFPPLRKIKIGDVGTVEGKLFERKDTLTALTNLQFALRGTPGIRSEIKNHMKFATNNGTEISFNADTKAQPAKAGIKIQFKSANSFFVNMAGVGFEEIESQLVLGSQILQLYKQGAWDKNWRIVTGVLSSKTTLIFGSSAGNSYVTFNVTSPVPEIRLDDQSLKFGLERNVSVEMEVLDYEGLTPFVELSGIKHKGLLGRKKRFGFADKVKITDEQLFEEIQQGRRNFEDTFDFGVIN